MPLTMRMLGKKGRFANQLLQYAFLRIESKGDYQCPSWIGQQLFGLGDPPVTKETRELTYKFPKHSSYYAPYKEEIRKWFTPMRETLEKITVRPAGVLIGLHLRRGDYGTFRRRSARWCFAAPTGWYLDWLRYNLVRFKNPFLFIASDEIEKVIDDFGDYSVLSSDRDVYHDFYLLTQCDVLLISNSTFGFVASMLNERGTEFWRPRLSLKKLIPYEPWDAPVIFMDEKY